MLPTFLCNIFSSELLFTNNGWFFSEPQAMVGTSISFTTLKDLSQKKQSGKRRYATSRKHVDAPDKRGTSGTSGQGWKGEGRALGSFWHQTKIILPWPPLRWPPDIFKGIHSLRGRLGQLGSAGLLQRRHQWACRAPPAAGHPPWWWATHPHPGRSVVGLQRPPLPAGTAPVAGQPPSQVEVKTTTKKWRQTSITLLRWNHLKISKIKLTLKYWMWFNPQFCCQPQQ